MNIFAVDSNPVKAAISLCDQHIKKMPIESAQMICAAMVVENSKKTKQTLNVPYKLTHKNHKCCVWARQTSENFEWLYNHSIALLDEYKFRYKKDMICHTDINYPTVRSVIDFCYNLNKDLNLIDYGRLTPFALAMPEKYYPEEISIDNNIESYKEYYIECKFEFSSGVLSSWNKGRNPPEWWPYQ